MRNGQFSRSVNIVKVADDFVLIVTHGLHNLLSLRHAMFAVSCERRYRTLDSISSPVAGTVTADLGKVVGK